MYVIHQRVLHEKQKAFVESPAKRKVIRAGRRGGKTVGASWLAVDKFLKGQRVLYATPTQDQIERFWFEVVSALWEPIEAGIFKKDETKHSIEMMKSETRIRAKTAWNADTLRGDYCDLLILDEWQLMNEDAWEYVGAPMLLDNNGDAVFIYTPPSLRSRSVSKANDPLHAAKMFKKAEKDESGRWQAFHFTSKDNPHISEEALREICFDMTNLAIRQEIEAEDLDDVIGALWTLKLIEESRRPEHGNLRRIVIGVDPQGRKKQYSETGIVAASEAVDGHYYILEDASVNGTPKEWGTAVVNAYHKLQADKIVAEANYGGEMVQEVITNIDSGVPVHLVNASRGKIVRAEPISALYEKGVVHHMKVFPNLEEEMTTYTPESEVSPNRLDAMVWAMTELVGSGGDWGSTWNMHAR